ncbi:MAG: hypothetical protein HY078_06235 [Elusimicrobia bacterium]|nr:hypothetical protein [Elusimicrobiota bacterium]
MRTRFAWLSTVVAVAAVVSVAVPAVAAERSATPSKEGTMVRPAPEDLRVEDMTDADLQQRLGEWAAGKRDDRDGYILLNQLWFNHRRHKTAGTAAAQQVKKQKEAVLAKHPEFGRLKDFRLSDRIKFQGKLAEMQKAAAQAAKQWVPADKTVRRIIGHDKKAVAVYQFRLEFLRLPADVELRPEPTAKTVLKLFRNDAQISASEISPWKTISYRNRFEVVPRYPDQVTNNFLVCSDLIHPEYHAMTQEERETMQARGFSRVMPWTNAKGGVEQACEVLSLDGDRVFSFPITQQEPTQLAAPLGMTADGTKAAIMIGEKAQQASPYGKAVIISKPREVLVWTQASGLKRVKVANKSATWNDLIMQFEQGKF